MSDTPFWVPLVSAIAGGSLVGIFTFIKDWQNRKSEERRHLRTLLINTAVENWKHNNTVAVELSKSGKNVEVMPLDSYIVNLLTLSAPLLDSTLTKDNIKAKLKEAYDISDEADKFIKAHNANTE